MLQYIFAGEGHSTVKVNNKYGSHALTRYLISTKHATQL
jgi:DNA-binding LacI/PurR family transcriptional regulator